MGSGSHYRGLTRYEFDVRKRNLNKLYEARADTAPGFLHVAFRTRRRVRKIAARGGTGWRGVRGDFAHAVSLSISFMWAELRLVVRKAAFRKA